MWQQFETIMEKVSGVLQKTCEDVGNLSHSATENKDNLFDGVGVGSFKAAPKVRSIAAVKQEQAERKKMLMRANQEAAMLPDFIRLVDYVGVEMLVELVINTTNDFLLDLLKPHLRAGVFETIVRFNDEVSGCIEMEVLYEEPIGFV